MIACDDRRLERMHSNYILIVHQQRRIYMLLALRIQLFYQLLINWFVFVIANDSSALFAL